MPASAPISPPLPRAALRPLPAATGPGPSGRPGSPGRSLIDSGALLLALNLLAGHIGCLSPPCRSFAAFVLCLPMLASGLRSVLASAPWPDRCLALALLAPVFLGFRAGGVYAVAGIFLGLLTPLALGGERHGLGPLRGGLALVTAGAGLWLLARETFPAAFVALENVSSLTCALSSLLARPPIALGPTYSGVSVALFFLIAHGALLAASQPRAWRWPLGLAAGQLALLVPYQLLFHQCLRHWTLDSPWMVLGVAQLALLLAGLGLVALHLRRATLTALTSRVPAPQATALAGACLLFMLCRSDGFWACLQPPVQPRVLLYDDATLDWSVPVYERYSGIAGGMFGLLGPFLNQHHCRATRGPLKPDALDQADVMVVFNLMHKFSAEEKRRIWQFVARGGSLLAVGDHTGTTHIREPFNDLLAPVRIEFNFDCALPRRMMWAEGLQCFQHYLTAGLDCPADTQISVGASLTVGWPAWPLIVGPHGFSDQGDLKNAANGYLGDRQYENDERLGDVVLVAAARHHQGKVLVFGDTTSFQNGVLPLSGDFVRAAFQWLAMKTPGWPRTLAVALLAALALALWARIAATVSWPAATLGLFVSGFLACQISALADRHCSRPPASAPAGTEALLDCSHLSRCSQDLWQDDGLGGLAQNLMRKHYLPVVTRRFSPALLQQSRLAFLVAPAQPFRPAELTAYETFVRRGGRLFISCGYEECGGCVDLLHRFGLGLRNLPLGPISPETNGPPVYFLNAWPVTSPPADSTVVCRRGQYPLIVSRRCGRGEVCLIGDSGFFLNRNLELPRSFNLQNIQFLRRLLPDHE